MTLFYGRGFFIFLKTLSKKLSSLEKVVVVLLLFVVVLEFINGSLRFYYRNAEKIPVKGGVIVEGMVGEPKLINPVLASTELDKTLSSLIFSGLVRYDENKDIVPALAERCETSPDRRTYTCYLKRNLVWHDGQAFNAEDVNYTIAVIQNPDYYGSLKSVWDGVKVEKIDDYTISFNLPKPYPLFLSSLTMGILPHHLWVNIPVKDFDKSTLNINAIGTGPYKIGNTVKSKDGKITSFVMNANDKFVAGSPNIESIEVKLYSNKKELLEGFAGREISSFGLYSTDDAKVAKKTGGYNNYYVDLPQYVALFFNSKHSVTLSDRAVREALAYSTNKEEINENVTFGAGVVIDSAILPGYLGYNSEVKKYKYDQKNASTILSQAGWSDQDKDGVKDKEGKKLSFDLVILDDPQFVRIAEALQKSWSKIGVGLNVKKFDEATLEQVINKREYDMLIIGENLGADPDLYSYWHSSQASVPGLNLAMYENGEADKLLEEARQTSDSNLRIKDYKRFQELIADDLPAIFLYQPSYVYKVSSKVKGIDLSGISNTWSRFYNVSNWYMKYRRK